MYLVAAFLYFVGFRSLEQEAWIWAVFALAGGFVLIRASTKASTAWSMRAIVVALLGVGAFANVAAIGVWLRLVPGTRYVVGYLGNTTPLYAWPHIVILVLSALTAITVVLGPWMGRPAEAPGPIPPEIAGRSAVHFVALALAGAGFLLGWLAVRELEFAPLPLFSIVTLLMSVAFVMKSMDIVRSDPMNDDADLA